MTTLAHVNPAAVTADDDAPGGNAPATGGHAPAPVDSPAAGPAPPPDPAPLDAAAVTRIIDEAFARRENSGRAKLTSALLATTCAGILALAATGYAGLRSDIRALDTKIDNVEINLRTEIARSESGLRAEIKAVDTKIENVETSLRTEIQEFRSEVFTVLLDHTNGLARIEERLTRVEAAIWQ